jgi:hypothetical protein
MGGIMGTATVYSLENHKSEMNHLLSASQNFTRRRQAALVRRRRNRHLSAYGVIYPPSVWRNRHLSAVGGIEN